MMARDDDRLIKLAPKGVRLLRDDTQISDDTRLMLEVAARLPGGFTQDELVTLVEDIIESFDDDVAAALLALKREEVLILDGSED